MTEHLLKLIIDIKHDNPQTDGIKRKPNMYRLSRTAKTKRNKKLNLKHAGIRRISGVTFSL